MQCKIMHISSAWKALTDHAELPSSVYSILWKRACKLLIMIVFYDMSNWDCFLSSIVRYKIYSQRSKWGAAVPIVCGRLLRGRTIWYGLSFAFLPEWSKDRTNFFSDTIITIQTNVLSFYQSDIIQAFFMFAGISLIKQNLNKFCLLYNIYVLNYTIIKHFD